MEKTEEIKRYLKFQKKLRALRLGEDLGCKYACEVFKISKTTYYNWKRKYDKYGEEEKKQVNQKTDLFTIVGPTGLLT